MATVATKSISTFVPSSQATSHRLYPGKSLGMKHVAVSQLLTQLEKGFKWSAVTNFLRNTGFSQQELEHFLSTPSRTFARRRELDALNSVESEKLLNLSEIFDACLMLFDGDKDASREWLMTPARGLGNVRPIDYARTYVGAREVLQLLGRIEHGIFS